MTEALTLGVAGLVVKLDALGERVALTVGGCHEGFQLREASEEALELRVRQGPLRSTASWQAVFVDPLTWELWLDDQARYVFVPPRSVVPRRQVTVDRDFRRGEVLIEAGAGGEHEQPLYPLHDIDMALFSNWLASSGGFIVHAAGVDHGGAGYCFVGASGAGKSTLATALARVPSFRVLGEDQVIVRGHGDVPWMYGTPWHMDAARCSPRGVPLCKVFFLDRTCAEGVHICPPDAAVVRLVQEAFVPYYNRDGVQGILAHLSRLAAQVAFFLLSYPLGSDVAALIRQA